MTENLITCKSYVSDNRVLKYHWKGMSEDQKTSIYEENLRQIKEKEVNLFSQNLKKLKEDEDQK